MLLERRLDLVEQDLGDYERAFSDALACSVGEMNDERVRLNLLAGINTPEELLRISERVSDVLFGVQGPVDDETPIFRCTSFGGEQDGWDGRFSVAGMGSSTFVEGVAHVVLESGRMIIEAGGLPMSNKQLRMAAAYGIVASEGQMNPDGNKRLGRAFHGFIQGGAAGAKQHVEDRAHNITHIPDGPTEAIILSQNLEGLLRGATICDSYLAYGPVRVVSRDTASKLEHASLQIDHVIGDNVGLQAAMAILGRVDTNAGRRLINKTVGSLLVRGYGPAAYVLALGRRDELAGLSVDDMNSICEASDLLHAARLRSLVAGVVMGGEFPFFAQQQDGGGDSQLVFTTHRWFPRVQNLTDANTCEMVV